MHLIFLPFAAKILDGAVMEIKIDIYLNRLIVRKHNGFIKVITGICRSGKSYLLNVWFHNRLVEEVIDDSHIIKRSSSSKKA